MFADVLKNRRASSESPSPKRYRKDRYSPRHRRRDDYSRSRDRSRQDRYRVASTHEDSRSHESPPPPPPPRAPVPPVLPLPPLLPPRAKYDPGNGSFLVMSSIKSGDLISSNDSNNSVINADINNNNNIASVTTCNTGNICTTTGINVNNVDVVYENVSVPASAHSLPPGRNAAAESQLYMNTQHVSHEPKAVAAEEGAEIMFVDNKTVKKVSASGRIALAYKYAENEIQPWVDPEEDEDSVGFRGSAEEDDKKKERELTPKNPTSFPPYSPILKMWYKQSVHHLKSTKKIVVMADPASASTTDKDQEKKPGQEPQFLQKISNPAFSKQPVRKEWAYQIHDPSWCDYVRLDGDIHSIVPEEKKKKFDFQMEMRLAKKDWVAIQQSQGNTLDAMSHAGHFLHSSRNAINKVLCGLDPVKEAHTVEALRDVKAMLTGVGFSCDFAAKNSVFVHAGLTAAAREQFIKQECVDLPDDLKVKLINQPFGGHMLFNNKLHDIVPQLKASQKETRDERITEALATHIETTAQTGGAGAIPKLPKGRGRGAGPASAPSSFLPDPKPGPKPSFTDSQPQHFGHQGRRNQGNQGNQGTQGAKKKKWFNKNKGQQGQQHQQPQHGAGAATQGKQGK